MTKEVFSFCYYSTTSNPTEHTSTHDQVFQCSGTVQGRFCNAVEQSWVRCWDKLTKIHCLTDKGHVCPKPFQQKQSLRESTAVEVLETREGTRVTLCCTFDFDKTHHPRQKRHTRSLCWRLTIRNVQFCLHRAHKPPWMHKVCTKNEQNVHAVSIHINIQENLARPRQCTNCDRVCLQQTHSQAWDTTT